jgi:UDP:flavonoid glycosyltransferase YjiC (YdhE family)
LWGDHYDYATRVEYLGIGVFGSPKSAPNWTAEEVGNAFLRVLDGGDESTSIKEKARALGEVARKAGGRSTAAREIAKLARTGSV